jgi:hypothetical protein
MTFDWTGAFIFVQVTDLQWARGVGARVGA